jgi:hypothetical protein
MNYFGKGNTTTYDRMIPATIGNGMTDFHTYALNWTAESLTWLIDDAPIRTLNYADANGGKNFPQTPSTVRIGIWAGGDSSNSKGTIEWAGGETDYSKAPFTMSVETVKITNYSPGTEYKWTDKTGSFESIEVIEPGKVEGAPVNSGVIAPSATGTGGGVQSVVNVPTVTGVYTNGTAPCTTEVPVVTKSGDCGTQTVTITLSSGEQPPATTEAPVASTTAGIVTDTMPAPSVPYPTAPVPSANATTSAPAPEFTGAASRAQIGSFVGLMAGAAMLLV